MKRLLVGIIVLVGVLGAGWWFGSPWWTLRQMRDAAAAHDAAALAAHVDAPALRADLVRQLRARFPEGEGGRERIAARVMLAALAAGAAETAVALLGTNASEMTLEHRELDSFRLVPKDGRGITFRFRRDGLGWKLAGAEIPADFALTGR